MLTRESALQCLQRGGGALSGEEQPGGQVLRMPVGEGDERVRALKIRQRKNDRPIIKGEKRKKLRKGRK